MTNKNIKTKWRKPAYIIGITLMCIAIIGMTTGGVAGQGGISPSVSHGYIASGDQPNPTMNTNITWSTFYNGWNTMEYYNGTANTTLNTGLSNIYNNPIGINPTDIKGSGLNSNAIVGQFNSANDWLVIKNTAASEKTTNTSSSISFDSTANTTVAGIYCIEDPISIAKLPSANLNFDYLTLTGSIQDTAKTSNTLSIQIQEQNATKTVYESVEIINNTAKDIAGGYELPVNNEAFYISTQMNQSTQLTNPTYANIFIIVSTPAETDNINLTLNAMAITSTPLTFGNANNNIPTGSIGNLHLSKLNPNFSWTSINNNGYTVETSQPLQNFTVSQASINSGKYVESATYQGVEELQAQPDLTYGVANITMPVNLPGIQYKVAMLNGVSYTGTLGKMNNGTLNFGTVNPESPNSVIIQVEYTSAQWNSVSSPPGFFSNPVGTIEYYWYIFLGITLGAIGLGAGIKGHAQGFRGAKR